MAILRALDIATATVPDRARMRRTERALNAHTRNLGNSFRTLFRGVAVLSAGASAALAGITASAVAFSRDLDAGTRRTGIAIERLQQLSFTLESFGSPQGLEDTITLVQTLLERVEELGRGESTAVDFLQTGLGFTYDELRRLDPGQVLDQFITRLRSLNDITLQNSIAIGLLGGEGERLVGVLSASSEEYARVVEQARRLNTISSDNVETIRRLGISFNLFQQQFQANFLTSFLDSLEIDLADFDQLNTALQDVADFASRLGTVFGETVQLIRDNADAFTQLGKALGILVGLKLATSILSPLAGIAKELIGIVPTLIRAGVAGQTFGKGLILALAPLAKIGLLVAGIVVVFRNWNNLMELGSLFLESLVLAGRKFSAAFTAINQGLPLSSFQQVFDVIDQRQREISVQASLVGSEISNQINSDVKAIFDFAVDTFKAGGDLVREFNDLTSNINLDTPTKNLADASESLQKSSENLTQAATDIMGGFVGGIEEFRRSTALPNPNLGLGDVQTFMGRQPRISQEAFTNVANDYLGTLNANLSEVIRSGNFDDVGDAFVKSLQQSLVEASLQNLTNILGNFLFGAIGQGGTRSGGLFRGIFGFQDGGPVPGREGQPTFGLLHGGEFVLNRRQQDDINAAIEGGPNVIVNQNFPADPGPAILRAARENARELTQIIENKRRELRFA